MEILKFINNVVGKEVLEIENISDSCDELEVNPTKESNTVEDVFLKFWFDFVDTRNPTKFYLVKNFKNNIVAVNFYTAVETNYKVQYIYIYYI